MLIGYNETTFPKKQNTLSFLPFASIIPSEESSQGKYCLFSGDIKKPHVLLTNDKTNKYERGIDKQIYITLVLGS